ncbi:XRE family transcriptional regulator [Nocardia amikacinitolerans]|uniref:XRE family transcriptional regulator n=1 Tax=Nocardia amikacinitolerans TaxID=756689 RepID=UPI0020A3A4D5|nr:XRE family transcriptional regulator [Nocardia amikacinitolerans]
MAEAVNDYLWRKYGQRRELDSHTIARYERGAVRWPNQYYREAFRAILTATDTELGFVPSRRRHTPDRCSDSTLAVNIFSPFDPTVVPGDYLELDGAQDKPVIRVGWTEVEQVQRATRAAASQENLHGGGPANVSAGKQLARFVPYLDAHAAPTARRALLEAVGNLSGVAGYAAFDIGDYPLAERRFRLALWCADNAGSWELRASTLADMARKTAYVGNPDGALSLIELAQVRADRLSATACAMLCALRAQYLAALGRTDDALAEVARADAHFADRRPAEAPWLCFYDEAEHLGSTGKALMPVARIRRRLDVAASRIRRAVVLQGAAYPRSRTFSLTRLATLTMQLGDPGEAAGIGLRAVQQASSLHSERIHNELRTLAVAAAPRRRLPEVAELRNRIADTVAAR